MAYPPVDTFPLLPHAIRRPRRQGGGIPAHTLLVAVAATTLLATAARAGPAHVLSSRVLAAAPVEAAYALSPALNEARNVGSVPGA